MFALRMVGSVVALAALTLPTEAGDGPKRANKPLTEKDCEKLVEQLASPHKPPFAERYVLDLPERVDLDRLQKKQEKIKEAYDALSANVEVALPALIKGTSDDRFSYVYEVGWNGAFTKASVGHACYRILTQNVEAYHKHTYRTDGTHPPRSLHFIADGCGGLDKWWEKRKGKSLASLQLEAIEWAMRQPQPKHFKSKKDWDKAVRAMEKMAKQVRESGKPIAVKHTVEFFGK
jgi:hypothetical protein